MRREGVKDKSFLSSLFRWLPNLISLTSTKKKKKKRRRNETKRNETKRNETKRNESKKQNKTNQKQEASTDERTNNELNSYKQRSQRVSLCFSYSSVTLPYPSSLL